MILEIPNFHIMSTAEVRFIDPLATKHALENRRTVLETLVENPHNKPVTWYKNGEEIKPDDRYCYVKHTYLLLWIFGLI